MKRQELDVTAHLARLQLSEAEIERFESAVAQMLEYFSKMREFETEGLSPTAQMTSDNRTREDVAATSLETDSLLSNAPELEDRFIVIPNVL
jgi:aspartyl-tRNA(Asn)/glutamyl-tRNA(Gln) amidotransferase subunit C